MIRGTFASLGITLNKKHNVKKMETILDALKGKLVESTVGAEG